VRETIGFLALVQPAGRDGREVRRGVEVGDATRARSLCARRDARERRERPAEHRGVRGDTRSDILRRESTMMLVACETETGLLSNLLSNQSVNTDERYTLVHLVSIVVIVVRLSPRVSRALRASQPKMPPSLQSTASADMPRMMFRNKFAGMGLLGVPPTPTYSLSIFAFIASLTSPGLRSFGAAGAGGSCRFIERKKAGRRQTHVVAKRGAPTAKAAAFQKRGFPKRF
jgi:hypothetical protein